jgi:hypothetical protein
MSEPTEEASPVADQALSEPTTLPRLIAPLALVIAVIAVGVAVWALQTAKSTPPSSSTPAPTSQETADAKARACGAFNTVSTAVSLQTHADPGTDPVAAQAIAANVRVSMAGGASYLLDRTDAATPYALADAIRSFASGLQDIAMNSLAGVSKDDPAQVGRLRDAESVNGRIADLCK